jgi:hypothetical protein
MYFQIEQTKVELTQVEESFIDGIGLDDLLDELVWHRLSGLVVASHPLQHPSIETPILEALRWG